MSDLIACRIERTQKYRSISLLAVEDGRMSWAAKGLHTYLISRPDGWKLYYSDLLSRSCNSRSALKTAINDLKKNGYLIIEPVRGAGGKFAGWSWTVRESPRRGTESTKTDFRFSRKSVFVQGNKNNKNSKNNNHTRVCDSAISELQSLFPAERISAAVPALNIQYFLYLYRAGKIRPENIKNISAYLRALTPPPDWNPAAEQAELRRQEQEAEARLAAARRRAEKQAEARARARA